MNNESIHNPAAKTRGILFSRPMAQAIRDGRVFVHVTDIRPSAMAARRSSSNAVCPNRWTASNTK